MQAGAERPPSGSARAGAAGSVCLVVSHYNARPQQMLDALLDQTRDIDAGGGFHTRVVVNAGVDKPLLLPPRHRGVEVLMRENTGWNIGAWDHGWRTGPSFDKYVFLQDECVLRRPGWLGAYVSLLERPDVGFVGESLVWTRPWSELEAVIDRSITGLYRIDGKAVDRFTCIYEVLRRHGVARGPDGSHLQSLVLACRRDVLERIGAFPLGKNYGEAVCTEVLLSKKVQALGLSTVQAGWLPFTYIVHPQWLEPAWKSAAKQAVARWAPPSVRKKLLRERRSEAPA